MVRSRRTWMMVATATVAVLLVGGSLWWTAGRSQGPAPPPLPQPNGFDDFVQAGRMISGRPPREGKLEQASPEELRAWVEPNEDALERARLGLTRESLVPVGYAQDEPSIAYISPIRQVSRLMAATALLAEHEGRTDDALAQILEMMRYSQATGRGGLLIHRQLALVLERIGMDLIPRLRRELSAEQCRELIQELLALDGKREPVAETFAMEAIWRREAIPLQQHVVYSISSAARKMANTMLASGEAALERQFHELSARTRLLATDLAIQAYRLEYDGADPEGLADLVPEYLPAIPLDPFSGEPLVYRPQGEGFQYQLYAFGPDGQDDGGQPLDPKADWSKARGDLVLD